MSPLDIVLTLLSAAQGRLKPGRMLLVDVQERKVTRDEELKLSLATSRPLGSWLKQMVSRRQRPCL